MARSKIARSCALLCVLCSAPYGCGDDEGEHTASFRIRDAGTDGGADAQPPDNDDDNDDDSEASEDEPREVVTDEACDDADDGDDCGGGRHCAGGRCVFNTCGDGVKAGREECDDGNEAVGDGCDPACKIIAKTCGDGEVDEDGGEECDDGNLIDDDDCSNDCLRNDCGNERIDGEEECDDGNGIDDDDCSNDCTRNVCRNGRLDPGEECDDGNRVNDDDCSNACESVPCGDGRVQQDEECDDGNSVDNDGCSNECTQNECGNQRTDPGETCDGDVTEEGICNDSCSAYEQDLCFECMEQQCTNYSGFDLMTSCHVEVDTSLVPNPGEQFVERCKALDSCARANTCSATDVSPLVFPCFCGDLPANECQDVAMAPGVCVEAFEDATYCPRGGDVNCVLNAMTDLTLPAGFASFLAQCRLELCPQECGLTQ